MHRPVDELKDSELVAARRYLEYLRNVGGDPFLQALMEAPLDDEPETKEEAAAVRETKEQYARGEAIPDEEVWKKLGHGLAHRAVESGGLARTVRLSL